MTTTSKVIIYARVSSKEQEEEGFSIPSQPKLLREYAQKNRFEIVEEFVDVETAKQAGRANFGQMVHFLKESPSVKAILVEKTDRLYRNFKDYVTIDELGVEIHLVKEGEVLGPASRSHQKFIHGIRVLMAKNYIDNLSEEVRKGHAEKAEQGEYPSHYYHCSHAKGKCGQPYVCQEVLEAEARRLLEDAQVDEERLAWLRESLTAATRMSRPTTTATWRR